MATIDPVNALSESNVPLLDGTPVVGGYQLVGDGTESVCLTGQTDPLENDIYEIPLGGGAWVRRADFDTIEERKPFTEFWVKGGNYQRTRWYLWNIDAPEPGVDPAYFQQDSRGAPAGAGPGLELTGSQLGLQSRGLAGTWQVPTIETDEYGLPISITTGSLGTGFIEGLALRYVSDTQVALDPGAAYVLGLNRIVEVDVALTATPLSGNDAVYYAYLTESNGVGELELSATEPDAPYFGSARTMLGDTTRRYLGMLKNDFNGDLISFEDEILGGSTVLRLYGAIHNSDRITALNQTADTTRRIRSIGPDAILPGNRVVSPAARVAIFNYEKASGSAIRLGWPIDPVYNLPPALLPSSSTIGSIPPLRLSPDQQLYYEISISGTNNFYLFCLGYYDRR